MTQQLNGAHSVGQKCEWPTHYNDQERDFDLCGATALYLVKTPAPLYLCEEHYQAYLVMIGKKESHE